MPIPICFAIDNTLETKSSAFFFINELERQKMLTSKIRGEHFFTCAVLLSLMTLSNRIGLFMLLMLLNIVRLRWLLRQRLLPEAVQQGNGQTERIEPG